MKKRALISVFDKNGVRELAEFLNGRDWEIISTGGTKKYLTECGIPVIDVSAITGFPECLDGRVKTLHPRIHAGILAKRDEPLHMRTLEDQNIGAIDLVCVNLYPFFEKARENLPFEETIEFIDIGGPSMLRAAAKNFKDVITLSDAADYEPVMEALAADGDLPRQMRKRLAGKVFNLTSAYDAAVSRFLLSDDCEGNAEYFSLPLKIKRRLRYGENSHQRAALYTLCDRESSFNTMSQIQGKELSYNNIRDLDAAWKAACAFDFFTERLTSSALEISSAACALRKKPVCFALKHNTPCGAAVGDTVFEAYSKAFACDPTSIFGGIISCNKPIDEQAALEMSKTFLEVIIAPDFTEEALEIFSQKKNLRLIKSVTPASPNMEIVGVDGGLLVQDGDARLADGWKVVTKRAPAKEHISDAIFGLICAIFVKSNAIVVARGGVAVGIAGGQTNRVWAVEQALARAEKSCKNERVAEVLISDAYFPFKDSVETAARYGIKTIIQPGGSIRDEESINACDEYDIAMVFTGLRHFKH